MIFHVKCDNSIKGVMLLAPFMLALANLFWFKQDIREAAVILVIGVCISFFMMVLVLPTKYVIEPDYLLIVRVWGSKKILYENIDSILKKNGKVSVETPSVQQLWVMKGDKVIAQLSPIKMEEFEKALTKQLSGFLHEIK